MRLNVALRLKKGQIDLCIPVGSGASTFKWLGNAAVQTAARHHVGQTIVSGRYRPLPVSVHSNECPFFHPDERLRDHLKDGDEVIVDALEKLPLDRYNSPDLPAWARIAFDSSKEGREERERLVKQKRAEIEDARERREEEERRLKRERDQPRIRKMREVLASQLEDEAEVEAHLTKEWNQIVQSGVLDSLVGGEEEQNNCKDFFSAHYSDLVSDLFKSYSALNTGGATHTMEYIEFSEFLAESTLFPNPSGEHSSRLLQIFVDSQIGRKRSRGNGGSGTSGRARRSIHKSHAHFEIRQREWMVALLRLAVFKLITIPKRERAALRRKGHVQSVAHASMPSPSEALALMYEQYLRPLTDKCAGSELKSALGSDEMLLTLYDHLDDLRAVFDMYSKDGVMGVKQFVAFATDAGFLEEGGSASGDSGEEGKGGRNPVTAKDVRRVFAASQHDRDVSATEDRDGVVGGSRPTTAGSTRSEGGSSSDHHQALMDFAEFVESVTRLGYSRWSGSDIPFLDMVRGALRMTCACGERSIAIGE